MPATQSRVNDFVLKIATVNGTGSASANGLLLKALFRMGVPVTGKNLFPSNIQGLPTWYEIRANKDGYMSRTGRVDVMVAMNAQTRDLEVFVAELGQRHTQNRDVIPCQHVPARPGGIIDQESARTDLLHVFFVGLRVHGHHDVDPPGA